METVRQQQSSCAPKVYILSIIPSDNNLGKYDLENQEKNNVYYVKITALFRNKLTKKLLNSFIWGTENSFEM